MAKKDPPCDFNTELKKLKTGLPDRIYLLYGEEDYLRDHFYSTLKAKCLPEGDDGFAYKRFNGPSLDPSAFSEAVDMLPFLTERTMVELRNVDVNRLPEADRFVEILQAVPETCTVVFLQDAGHVPDGRLKLVRFIKQRGRMLEFGRQDQQALTGWIRRRFSALGKEIAPDASARLVLISGDLMNRLIPEIDKVASYAKGDRVLVSDVEAVASHIPEADIFDMVNQISGKKFDAALHILAELLANKENSPTAILATLSYQLRRLYGVKLALRKGFRKKEIKELFGITWDNIADRLILSAGHFSLPQLAAALENCASAEYRMKTSSSDDTELLKEVIMNLILGDTHV